MRCCSCLGFRKDVRGRVPFALVAVALLIGTGVLASIVTVMTREAGDHGRIDEESSEVLGFDDLVRSVVVDVSEEVLVEGLALGMAPEDMAEGLMASCEEGIVAALWAEAEDWWFDVMDLDIGVDLSGAGAVVVGHVDWMARSQGGNTYLRRTELSEGLDRPFGLAYDAMADVVVSGDEGGWLARLVRDMVFRLAVVRTANGELLAWRALTTEDIGKALELALSMFLANGSDSGGMSPANMFLGLMDETVVRPSSVIAQYALGLLDQRMLYLRDYMGIGEGVEAFFEWVGAGLGGDPDDMDAWWVDLNVGDVVERWAFEVLSEWLHLLLSWLGDDEMDVTGMDNVGMSNAVVTAVGGVAGPGGGLDLEPGHGMVVMEVPAEVTEAMASMPVDDAERCDIMGRLKGSLADLVTGGLEGILDGARALAIKAWEDVGTVDRLHNISVEGAEGVVPPADLSGAHISGATIVAKGIEYDVDMSMKGVHHTAPEGRWDRDRSLHVDDPLQVVRPYETDYRIKIEGSFKVERLLFHRLSKDTRLGSTDVLEADWTVPMNISIVVPVFSGVPLEGVDYDPSDTLFGDLAELAWGFVNWTWSGICWVAGAFEELFSGIAGGITELGRRAVQKVGDMSAATFSRTVESVLKAVQKKAWNDALNITWRFLRELIGEDVRELLTFHLDIFGFMLKVELDLFHESLLVTHQGEDHGFSLVFRLLVEDTPPFRPDPVDGLWYALLGKGKLRRGGLTIEAALDPLTIEHASVVHVFGETRDDRGRGVRFELDAPVVEKTYKVMEVSISSLSGTPIRGIPVPGTGLSMDVDAGLRVRYGKGLLDPLDLLIRAVRGAWYETLRGYSMKEIYGDLGDPELLEAFLVQLLNNIGNCIGDRFADQLPEIELFLEGGLSAGNGAAAGGFGLSFVIKDPVHVLMEVVPWVIENLRAFLSRLSDPGLPSGFVAMPSKVMEGLFVRSSVHAHIGAPDILGGEDTGRLRVGGMLEANVPALGALVGMDQGRWMVKAGVVMPGLPSTVVSLLPGLDPPRPRCDLWLVQLSVMELDNDRALISEVYYDTSGKDSDEEFIELWNPTSRGIDLSRWVLEDNGGRWRLPDHLRLPAQGRIVVARDRDGFREVFDRLPDVSGLPLSLNNDGDSLTLLDPYGVEIDRVGWENGLHGWGASCKEGTALHRVGMDRDRPDRWYCAGPGPWQ